MEKSVELRFGAGSKLECLALNLAMCYLALCGHSCLTDSPGSPPTGMNKCSKRAVYYHQ